MDTYLRVSVLSCLVYLCAGQYGQQYVRPQVKGDHQAQAQHAAPVRHYAPDPYAISKPVTPAPLIISHKQALSHDGGFNYAFAADNGLQQGESIAPDGTRRGGYSYVDPHGKKITVRYTAGKDGFRIVEGDHLPRATYPVAQPAAHQPQEQPQYRPQPQYTPSPGHGLLYRRPSPPEDDGQYRHQEYQRPQQFITHPQPAAARPQTYKLPESNSIQQEPDYSDEPGKPHSFGVGYTFEFSG